MVGNCFAELLSSAGLELTDVSGFTSEFVETFEFAAGKIVGVGEGLGDGVGVSTLGVGIGVETGF